MKEQKAVTNSVLILVANLQFLIMVSLKKKKRKKKSKSSGPVGASPLSRISHLP